jgi:hypothetical protein
LFGVICVIRVSFSCYEIYTKKEVSEEERLKKKKEFWNRCKEIFFVLWGWVDFGKDWYVLLGQPHTLTILILLAAIMAFPFAKNI